MADVSEESPARAGKELERSFAMWLEEDADYDSVELNKNVSPGSGGASYEVDVYGTRKDPRSVKIAKFGAGIYFLVVIAYWLEITEVQQALKDTVSAIAPGLASSTFIVFLVAGGAIAFYGIRKLETRTYVECKDWKKKVGRPQVSRLVGRMQDFGDEERRERDRETWILVSGKGFSKPALEAAETHDIRLYEPDESGFKTVSL